MYLTKNRILFSASLAITLTLGAAVTLHPAEAQTARSLVCKGCVKSKQVRNNGIKSKDIKDGQVKTNDLAVGAVTGAKIEAGTVTADKLSTDALAGGRIPVEDCGVIDQPGNYVLVNDLPGPLGLNLDGGCLAIEADDVTLDLAGFSMVGKGKGDGDGIDMDGRSNVTIRNGTIRNFDSGIAATDVGASAIEFPANARNIRVSDIQAILNRDFGILLEGSGHQVTSCQATDNGSRGIRAGSRATVTGNRASGNGEDGISTAHDSMVTGNRATDNGRFGIKPGDGSAVAGNVATGNKVGNIAPCATCQEAGNVAPAVVE